MPDEALITEIENVFAEIIDLGGQNEDSKIVPNLTVQDASPTNLDGWLIVSDDRDGDNILARKVGSVVYADNDLVNVMFLKGGEAIAFQQGSESGNNGIWEIVPSTSTNIFYDKGDIGINTSATTFTEQASTVSAHLFMERENVSGRRGAVFSSITDLPATNAQNAYLKARVGPAALADADRVGDFLWSGHDGTDYNRSARFGIVVDGSVSANTVPMAFTFDTSETNSAGITERMRIAADGNVGVGWDTTNLRLSIADTGTNTVPLVPGDFLPGAATPEPEVVLGLVNENASGNYVGMSFQVRTSSAPGAVIGFERTANFQGDLFVQIRDAAGTSPEIMRLRHNGNVSVGPTSPLARLHVDQDSTTAAQPVLYLDQADVSEEMIEFNTTIGVGNAIEAVGAKTLTTTHFIKVTLPGALTRYFPVGTIA